MNIFKAKIFILINLIFVTNMAFSDDASFECEQMKVHSQSESKDLRLIAASATGNIKELDDLIFSGVSPNVQDDELMTPLAWASYCGHLKVVERLIEKGAKVNLNFSFSKNMKYINKNSTALIWAVAGEKADIVSFLLKKGANIKCREKIYSIDGQGKEIFVKDGRNAIDVAKDIEETKKNSTFVKLLDK